MSADLISQGGVDRVSSVAGTRTQRRGIGLPAVASIGIILASTLLGVGVSRSAAVDQNTAACERPLDIILVIDRSGSMDEITGGKSRLSWANDAANDLVTNLQNNGGVGGATGLHQVGLTTYGGATATVNLPLGNSDATAVHNAINVFDGSVGDGVTPLRQGMAAAAGDMAVLGHARDNVDGVPVIQVLILLSDGRPNPDNLAGGRPSAAQIAAFQGPPTDQVFAVAIGPVGQGGALSAPDLPLMNSIANPSGSDNGAGDFVGGNYRHVLDALSLPNLFASIGEELLCGDIHITKAPDPAGPVAPGIEVTYTYAVINSSEDTPITNVEVTDDQCDPVTGPVKSGGDNDGLLEFGETWTYECTMPLAETTENTACAAGDFIGGGSDSDCAVVTVEVETPSESESESASESQSQSPEQSVAAGTGTPEESQPDTGLELRGGGAVPTILFSFLLVASLGALAYANVQALRRRG